MKHLYKKSFIIFIGILTFFSLLLEAHPVIYKDGTVLESESTHDMARLRASYNLTAKISLGSEYYKYNSLLGLNKQTSEIHLVSAYARLYRNNTLDSQSNIYFGVQTGQERSQNESYNTLGYALMGDWEDRDYYTSVKFSKIESKHFYERSLVSTRVGFSPFRADMNDLNIWYIAQFDQKKTDYDKISLSQTDNIETTLFIRTYFKNVLFEIGNSLNGSFKLNLMTHL